MATDLGKNVIERKVVEKTPKKSVSPLPTGILSKQEFRAMEDGMQKEPVMSKTKKAQYVSTRLTDQDENEKVAIDALKSFTTVLDILHAPFYGHLYPDKVHNKKMTTYLSRITRAVRGLKGVADALKQKEHRTIEAFKDHFNKSVPLHAETLRLALNGLDEEIAKHA